MTMYHRYVYMPPKIDGLEMTITDLAFTDHAFEALEDDDLQYFDKISFTGKQIIEAETKNGFLIGVVVELPHSRYKRKYVALQLKSKTRATVKTVYLREKDRDMSIVNKDASKYYRPINMSEKMS